MPLWAWWTAAKRAGANIFPHRLSTAAAGVAFFAFLSMFPAIATLVFIYGLVADVTELRIHLLSLASFLPDEVLEIIFERLEFVVEERNTTGVSAGLVLSLVLALWSGSRGVATLVEVIGTAYHQEDRRSILRSAVLSIFLTISSIVMITITLSLVAVIPAIIQFSFVPDAVANWLNWIRWPVVLVLVFAGLCMFYKLAPDRRDAKMRWLMPGAFAATLVWGLMSVGFSVYVENFASYDATFGSISAIVVLLLWFYYSVFIIALGAEFNAELELLTRVDTTVGPSLPIGSRQAFVADNVRAEI